MNEEYCRGKEFLKYVISNFSDNPAGWHSGNIIGERFGNFPDDLIVRFLQDPAEPFSGVVFSWNGFEKLAKLIKEKYNLEVRMTQPGGVTFEYEKREFWWSHMPSEEEPPEEWLLDCINENVRKKLPDFCKKLIKIENTHLMSFIITREVEEENKQSLEYCLNHWASPATYENMEEFFTHEEQREIEREWHEFVEKEKEAEFPKKTKKEKPKAISGIYRVYNKNTNRNYIGQSIDIHKRWAQHKNNLIKQKEHSIWMLDWVQHGPESFEWEIIEECEKKSLNEREEHWINHYDSRSILTGYNRK